MELVDQTELSLIFFFNDTATTEIYTLSLHDALPIYRVAAADDREGRRRGHRARGGHGAGLRSEEHTSELQSRPHLVCRLLLEKKNNMSQKSGGERAVGGADEAWADHPGHCLKEGIT